MRLSLIFQEKDHGELAAKKLIDILLKKTKKDFNIFRNKVPESVAVNYLSDQGTLKLITPDCFTVNQFNLAAIKVSVLKAVNIRH